MTLSFRSDATGGAILADGIEKIAFDVSGNVTSGITGEFKFLMRAAAPKGWIVANGQTIGNIGSGATRANVDTLALFTAWWTDYSDAQCPLLTSAGAGSTRGASAAADWAANKRLTVFDMTDDRFPVGANGAGTINGTKYADQFQGHKIEAVSNVSGSGPGSPYNALVVGASTGNETLTSRSFLTNAFVTDGTNGTPRVGSKTLPPRIGMLPLFKL